MKGGGIVAIKNNDEFIQQYIEKEKEEQRRREVLEQLNQPNLDTTAKNIWAVDRRLMDTVEKARKQVGSVHGMFSSVPIICRGRSCPYFHTCFIPLDELQPGKRCPIEIATILERFDQYCRELNIDPEKEIVDAGLVKEVVDLEIMMVRADGLLARDASVIEEVVGGMTQKGQKYYKPQIHTAVELKEKLRKEKTRILNQLNATRKDKKAELINNNDPSSVAAKIIQKVKELEKRKEIIDAEVVDVEVEED